MNAHQRRQTYRRIDRMIGKTVTLTNQNGRVVTGVVLGRTIPVARMASNCDWSSFDGSRPSVHRARVEVRNSTGTMSPLISKLRIV